MKKLLSTKYSASSFNIAMFILRLGLSILMLKAGYYKLTHYTSMKGDFMNFLGLGSSISLALVIFAEFFCSIFLILGLFTRLSTIPLIITMCVALFMAHKGDFYGEGQVAALYLIGYLVLLLVGPGRISIDGMAGK